MTRGIARKLLVGAGVVVGLLAVGLAAIITLVDVNAYKPEIVAQMKQATGRDVTIEGPIHLSLLPTLGVSFDGLRVANVEGAGAPAMVEARSVTVRLSLLGLLAGALRPAEVILAEPRVALQIDASGRPNWRFPATADSPAGSPFRLVVQNGAFTFDDARSALSIVVAKADVSASVGSADGPLSLTGGAVVNDIPATIAATARRGVDGGAGYVIDTALQVADGRLSFAGTTSEVGHNARLTGRASASADDLVAFARALIAMAGQPQPPLPPLLAGKFRFDGPVELSPEAFSSSDFTLALGDDSGMGSATVELARGLEIEARFTAPRHDLDRWLAALAVPDHLINAPTPASPADTAAVPQQGASWLAAFTGSLALDVGEVIYRGKPIRNLSLALQMRGGLVAVPKFTANLPGDLTMQASSTVAGDQAHPTVSGSFSLEGRKLRETLSWLGFDVSSVPAGKLVRLAMKGRMGSNAGNVTVSDATFELDELAGTGGIVVAFAVPASIVTHVELGAVVLDAYLPPDRAPAGFHLPVETATPILALLGPSIGLKLKVGRVDWQGDAITGVELDVARAAGMLKLNTVKIASLAGAQVNLQAAITDYWTAAPKANLAFDFRAPDIDRVLKLVGRPPSGVGPLSMAGAVAGSWENLAVRDFRLDAMGWRVSAGGALAMPGAGAGPVKQVSWKGDIRVNDQPIEAMIDADLSGARPVVNADLKTVALDFGSMPASGRGAPRVARLSDSEPIGAPLRSVDGTLKVSVARLAGAPLPLGNAEIAATLKEGMLTLSRFEGGLDGGTIALSGVIDGRQPSLSFDLKGEARGISLAQMLRRQSGSNEIGSLIRIAIDGRVDVTGVTLRGAGTTAAEIRRSLAGGADLTGRVQARADRFLALLGSATTGAVGGAIDITLGNIMSALGDRGGVGVGNLLNAISLVLHRYVNHDNALAGHLDITDGLVTDRNLTLQGNAATAGIVTRTDLGRATTDTTVNFMLAEDPSAPYLVVTARGPMASPSFQAARGQAKDPPGVFDKLPSLPRVTVPDISIPHIQMPRIPNPFGR